MEESSGCLSAEFRHLVWNFGGDLELLAFYSSEKVVIFDYLHANHSLFPNTAAERKESSWK